jgi:hypothetical protein
MIVDGSSAKINKINQALSNLARTAAKTQSALNKLGGGNAATKINATAKAVNALARAMGRLPKSASIGVKLRGNSANDLLKMARAMAQYKAASRNINTLIGAGGKTSSYANLDMLVQKLARVARAASLAANQLSRMKANIPGGSGRFNIPNPNARGFNGPPPRQNIGLEIQPLKSMLRSFVVDLGHTILTNVRQAFAEGIKGFDVAANKFNQQRIGGDVADQLRAQAFLGAERAPIWRPDERMDFYAEVASNFRDPRDAAKFDESIEKAIYTAVQQGGDRTEATTGIAQLLKGLGNAGYLQDAQGNLNKDITKYIDAYVAAKTSEGAQLNFNDAAQVLKYARTSAQSLTPREFFLQLIAAADIGASTQGVQLNQTMKNYAGETTKKALQAQEEGGLRSEGKMVKSGQVGNKTTYTYEAGKIKDEELLRENPSEWIAKNILGPGGYLEKKGLDVNKDSSAKILSALDPLAGNRNVDDFLAKAVLQFQERAIKASKFFDNPQTNEEMQRTNLASSWVQLQETTQQLIGLFGNLGDKLEKTFIPVIDTVGNWADRLNRVIEGKSPAEMQDYAALGGAGAVGVGGGLAGVFILKQLATGFGLPAAAAALTTSAAQLSAAAVKLGGGSVIDDATNAKSKAGWLTLLGGFITVAATGAIQSGSTADNKYLNSSPPDRQKARNEANGFYEAQNRAPEMQQQSADLAQWIIKLAKAKEQYQYVQDQKLNPSSDMYQNAEIAYQQASENVTRLQGSLTEGSNAILAAFDGGTTKLAGATDNFATTAASTLMGIANSFGSAAGAAMRQAIGTIGVNVNGPTGGPAPANTGTNTNLQTGG